MTRLEGLRRRRQVFASRRRRWSRTASCTSPPATTMCSRLNAKTGEILWERWSGIDQKITTVCCGWDNRGLAMGEGMLFLGQLDANVVALDMKTGKEVWKTPIEDWQNGYGITSAPLYYDGIVYSGITGGEYGVRGRLTALDAKTGKILWRWYHAAGAGRGRRRHLAGRHRPLHARRRDDLEHAGARSGARADLLRGRQLRARLRRLDARGRQSVLRLDRRAERQDRASTPGTSRRCTTTSGTTTRRARWCCSTP